MSGRKFSLSALLPDLPILIWMIVITLLIGLGAGFTAKEIIATYNTGWGYAAGEFALILLPSFIIAAAFDRQAIAAPPCLSVGLAPVAGAGMICPDTAYASLSPMISCRKLMLSFSSYSGFKLLFPAGPLIIATSLGVADGNLLAACFAMFFPVWGAGLIYSWIIEKLPALTPKNAKETPKGKVQRTQWSALLFPFALLFGLLIAGYAFDLTSNAWLDFATNPKGALIITACFSLCKVARSDRSACIDTAIRRSASLLLIIGAASAFSAFVTAIVDVNAIFSQVSGEYTLLSLFVMTAVFKLLQGSSMSTFAAAGPVAMPIVAASEISPILAVLAVCLGSFVAILPNDSFYWLIRKDALRNINDKSTTIILAGGSILQGILGLVILLAFHAYYPNL